MKSRRLLPALLAGCALSASPAYAQQSKQTSVQITGHVVEPEPIEPTDERVAGLQVPEGFSVSKFASGLKNPRMLAVADDGTVYVTRRDVGDVVMLKDTDGDGKADQRREVAHRPGMHGIAIDGSKMYLATVTDVYATEINGDGTLGELRRIIDDLPEGGQHPNRTLAIGPDGKLYITVGSTCNACGETNPENATVLRAEPDGSSRSIFASGLRNTIGFGWHPETGNLYGMDHGIDWLGDNEQREEFNRLEPGRQYGWPYIYEDGKHNPQDEPPGGVTLEEWAAMSEAPVLTYTPHAAPLQMAFYDGAQFPEEYWGDAFVAMRGSWNRKPPSGYEVVRIRFEDGEPREFEPFLTGFLVESGTEHWSHMGRLAGLAVAGDGALLAADDKNGVIYRVSYDGPQPGADRRATYGNGSERASADVQTPGSLAIELVETRSDQPIRVRSTAVGGDKEIARRHAAPAENISPPLAWEAAPDNTASYVVMMEDADAVDPTPYVHWIAYNIPGSVVSLPEGLPGQHRLMEPEGVLQGRNSYGAVGYRGMKPPQGDPPHSYHLQVFALDRMLDLLPGADRQQVLQAMEGAVLAEGELVGTYARD